MRLLLWDAVQNARVPLTSLSLPLHRPAYRRASIFSTQFFSIFEGVLIRNHIIDVIMASYELTIFILSVHAETNEDAAGGKSNLAVQYARWPKPKILFEDSVELRTNSLKFMQF